MKRIIVLAALVTALAVPATTAAGGVTNTELEDAGWTCVEIGEIHCFTKAPQEVSAAIAAMVFDPVTGEFLATEVLRFTGRDLSGVPCPKTAVGSWEDLGFAWACHHWRN